MTEKEKAKLQLLYRLANINADIKSVKRDFYSNFGMGKVMLSNLYRERADIESDLSDFFDVPL